MDMRRCLLAFAFVLVAGCGEIETDQAKTAGPAPVCVEQPFRAELHVDAHDSRSVWATDYETGLDVAVRPRPPGRFSFDLTRPTSLLDGDGNLVTFNGEISRTGCFDAASRTVYLGPADLPDPNRPPN